MYGFVRKTVLIFALLLVLSAWAAAVQVRAYIDSSQDIYIGERFTYLVSIEGADKEGEVDLTALQKYEPQSTGTRSQTSVQIINGRTTQSVTNIMTYSLQARGEGIIQLPPVTVKVDGRTYQTNPVQVNVLKPGTTDKLDLEVTLSERQCYVGQPVILTIKFYVSAEIGDYQLDVPALNSDAFYVEEPDDSSGRGTQSRVVHNGRDSILLMFRKVLIPKYAGEVVMAASTVSADVAVGRERSRDNLFDDFFGQKQYKRFMVSSEPSVLTVLPLPEEGKPPEHYGLVGRYTISATAQPTKVNVGDPITLTIRIGGDYLKPVQWPELEKVGGLAENFKIPSEKATPNIEGGFKIFTQTLRANNDKVTEIPPIPLAFFDPDRGEYMVTKTEPIKLEVAPTKILTEADLEGKEFTAMSKDVEAIKKGLSANYEGPDVLRNMSFSPLAALVSPGYMVLWEVPLIGLVLISLVKLFTHTSPEKEAAKRRRRACGKAIGELKEITLVDSRRRHELLCSTMKQYIGERFDKVAGSLTADDCSDVIITATQDRQTARKYRDIIAECEAANYSSAAVNVEAGQIREVINLIRSIDKKAK